MRRKSLLIHLLEARSRSVTTAESSARTEAKSLTAFDVKYQKTF